MKILLTGKNGQVGFELQRALALVGEVHAVGTKDCDLADEAALRALVRAVEPDLIVNPAAYTAVDRAESETALAHAINARAPAVLGEEAARIGARVIHFSTDYVFDGCKLACYTEDDPTNPQNVYGRSKLDGEQALQQSGARNLIFRTSWVVGAHGGNFAKTILRLAAERESLNIVADQFGAPTSAALLADATAHVVRQLEREKAAAACFSGVYNLVAAGETNWCDYARYIVAEAIASGRTLMLVPEAIRPISSQEYPTPARRPSNSRLDTSKFRNAFGLVLPHWQVGVKHILQQILETK